MSWWKRILLDEGEAVKPRRLDYLNEGLALERQGDLDGAVTSYQLTSPVEVNESAGTANTET